MLVFLSVNTTTTKLTDQQISSLLALLDNVGLFVCLRSEVLLVPNEINWFFCALSYLLCCLCCFALYVPGVALLNSVLDIQRSEFSKVIGREFKHVNMKFSTEDVNSVQDLYQQINQHASTIDKWKHVFGNFTDVNILKGAQFSVNLSTHLDLPHLPDGPWFYMLHFSTAHQLLLRELVIAYAVSTLKEDLDHSFLCYLDYCYNILVCFTSPLSNQCF